MKKHFKTFLHGIAIGVANIIPGISGGTIAVVLNIYDHLISSLSTILSPTFVASIFKKRIKDFTGPIIFLLFIFTGAITGIVAFSKLLSFLLTNYPFSTNSFFLGLIIGSIPLIFKAHQDMSFSISKLFTFLLGGSIITLTLLFPEKSQSTLSISNDYFHYLFLVLSGFIAAGSMVVPGISGSLMLVLMGSYYIILNAVSQFNIPIIFSVGIGAILGIVIFTKIIEYCLKRFPSHSYYLILGLIIGSIPKLWPGILLNLEGLLGYTLCGAGIYLAKKLG